MFFSGFCSFQVSPATNDGKSFRLDADNNAESKIDTSCTMTFLAFNSLTSNEAGIISQTSRYCGKFLSSITAEKASGTIEGNTIDTVWIKHFNQCILYIRIIWGTT